MLNHFITMSLKSTIINSNFIISIIILPTNCNCVCIFFYFIPNTYKVYLICHIRTLLLNIFCQLSSFSCQHSLSLSADIYYISIIIYKLYMSF